MNATHRRRSTPCCCRATRREASRRNLFGECRNWFVGAYGYPSGGYFAILGNTDMRVSLVILMGVLRKQGSVFSLLRNIDMRVSIYTGPINPQLGKISICIVSNYLNWPAFPRADFSLYMPRVLFAPSIKVVVGGHLLAAFVLGSQKPAFYLCLVEP